ncbi:hypothetical protein C7271_00170 [filamentous cyanobacterium CCP5]|nr:hypothetical protein C7271_00170 [filamentous cyanobacterium CCP5]
MKCPLLNLSQGISAVARQQMSKVVKHQPQGNSSGMAWKSKLISFAVLPEAVAQGVRGQRL